MATPITNENIDQFAITPANINDMAEVIASLNEYDFIYIVTYKAGAYSLSRIELNVFKTAVGAGLSADDIINNLTSTATNKALSAAQGKVLKELIDGGMFSSEIYTALKNNIDALWGKLNELIGDLASLAFSGTKTNQLTPNDKTAWPSQQGGGETPSSSPILTYPANNSTVNVGTNTGNGITKSITIQGSNLTQALSVSVSGTGFSVSPTPISAANANNGTTITVTYNGTDTNAAGTLTISSSEVSATVNLTASYQQQGGGDEPTPSDDFSHTAITIKRGACVSSATTSAITTSEEANNACTTQFVELSGTWHHIVIKHGMPDGVYSPKNNCKVICKYRDKNNNEGVTTVAYANVANSNNFYTKDAPNKIITVENNSARLDLGTLAENGPYEVTAIAFGVRNNPEVTNPTQADWSDNQYNSGTTYVDVYKTADDANPTRIFSSNPADNTEYTIVQ